MRRDVPSLPFPPVTAAVPPLSAIPPEGEPLLHTRDYRVDVYRAGPDRMRLRGQLRDTKPDGLWLLEGDDPVTVHHMIVDLLVEVPSLAILAAEPVMATHPHRECTGILTRYDALVGLSIARGFTHKVRELFGGPRGCTHVTMLLQAMAPVALQALFAFVEPEAGTPVDLELRDERRRAGFERNRNTCHVWAEDGPLFERLDAGEEVPMPIWAEERFAERGIDPRIWTERGA